MKRSFKSWAERKSLDIRKRIGLRSNEPLDCHLLCHELGVSMFTLADLHEFGFSQDHFLRLNSLDSNFFACMVPTPAGHILINNTNSSQNRSNSNIVHELSHVICEHNFSSIKPINGSILREFDQDSEDEANWLAGCLLLPREGLLWAHKKGLSIKQISNHFGTSEQMSRWRFNVTGVTKQIPGRRFSNSNN